MLDETGKPATGPVPLQKVDTDQRPGILTDEVCKCSTFQKEKLKYSWVVFKFQSSKGTVPHSGKHT